MPKSRDIQAKMPSPKVILNAFLLVTVKLLNSYDVCSISFSQTRSFFNHINLFHHSVSTGTQPAWLGSLGAGTLCGQLVASLKFLCPRCEPQEPGVCRVPFATTNFPYSRKFPAFLYLFIIPKYITNSSADAKIHATGLARQIPR